MILISERRKNCTSLVEPDTIIIEHGVILINFSQIQVFKPLSNMDQHLSC